MKLLSNLRTWWLRSLMQQTLLRADDRVLADAGFSRELLDLGLKGYPWRTASEPELTPRLNFGSWRANDTYATAIHELQSSTDKDLRDLGISRGEIVGAVLLGRSDSFDRAQAA